jgi:hypothetical protein
MNMSGKWNNPINLTRDYGLYDDFSNIPVKQELVEVPMTSTEDDSDAAMDEEEDIEVLDPSTHSQTIGKELVIEMSRALDKYGEGVIDAHLKSFE